MEERDITLCIKREDTIHPLVSGNKYRKLKYNLVEAQRLGKKGLLTFGGAFSNHIVATAYAGQQAGLATLGIIRGEELADNWMGNPTLDMAAEHGMQFHFISRKEYREKDNPVFLEKLIAIFGDFYVLPEGGTNTLAVKGCREILKTSDTEFDFICCAVGTGGTLAGLINSAHPNQTVLGFPVLKGNFLKQDILKFASNENWELVPDYHFGGYAKMDLRLIDFINSFKKDTQIALDPIYTGKMLLGILDKVRQGFFERGSRILAIHTGGLQGIKGMNMVLKKKKLPLLDL